MKIEINYPEIKKQISKMLLFRKILFILFVIGAITCGIVNICVGGKAWSLFVVGGEIVFYIVFLNKPLIEHTLVNKLTNSTLAVCAYLYLINLIEKQNWYYFVVTIILYGLILVQAMILFSSYGSQKKNLMPLFWMVLVSIVLIILAIVGVITLNWPIIVLGSCGLVLFLLFFTIFKKGIVGELKKKFHVN